MRRRLSGVYVLGGSPASYRQRVMVACLWAGPDAVASHRTAAVLWGLDGRRRAAIELSTTGAKRAPAGITVHRTTSLPLVDRAEQYGIPVTSAARTLVDLAGVVDDEALEIALEDVLHRRLTTPARLRWRLDEVGGKGRAGTRALRLLLDARRARPAESGLEVRLDRLLRAHGIVLPERQYEVFDGERWRRLDLADPAARVGVEADSYRWHASRRGWARDHTRTAALVAEGWRIVPVTSEEIDRVPLVVVERVRRTLDLAQSSLSSDSYSA